MMTLGQFVLLKIMEECSEVSQRASKAMQFGLCETQEGDTQDNRNRLESEISDLLATLHIAADLGLIEPLDVLHTLPTTHHKRMKLNKYLAHSRKLGWVETGRTL